jgi:hypothetical protein
MLWRFDPAQMHLPICSFRAATGLDCPGCGATRATHALLHGQLVDAWRLNALWVLLSPFAVYAAISEVRLLTFGSALPGNLAHRRSFWLIVIAAAMVFFVVRNW